MTQEELKQIAEQSWESCDGCTEEDKYFWISGFMRAANLFGDIDNLPNAQQLEEKGQLMGEMFNKLINNQQNLDPEYGQIIAENFWELTDDKTESPYCPICDACGEDLCCSAMNCKQHPDGSYCVGYLKDLKFSYKMDKWVADNLYHKMPKELQAEYDLVWDKMWDEIYANK